MQGLSMRKQIRLGPATKVKRCPRRQEITARLCKRAAALARKAAVRAALPQRRVIASTRLKSIG